MGSSFIASEHGEPITLKELKPGVLFLYEGDMCIKTEYRTEAGAIEAYIVGTGEMFWGGTNNAEELNQLLVQPLKIKGPYV